MAVIEAIATTYLEADAASVTFSGIPSTYEHLQLRVSVREETSAADRSAFGIQFNGDTAANYGGVHSIQGLGSSAGVSNWSDADVTDLIYINYGLVGGSSPVTWYSSAVVDILDYRNANKNKTVSYIGGWGGLSANPRAAVCLGSDFWDSTAAITSLSIIGSPYASLDFARGSEFTLYGLNSS